jgi:hypothetical protein
MYVDDEKGLFVATVGTIGNAIPPKANGLCGAFAVRSRCISAVAFLVSLCKHIGGLCVDLNHLLRARLLRLGLILDGQIYLISP